MFRSATGGLDAAGPDDGFGWVGFDEGWRVGCGVDVRGVACLEVRATIRDGDVDTEEQAATVTRSKTPIDVLTRTLPLIVLTASHPYGERPSPGQRHDGRYRLAMV